MPVFETVALQNGGPLEWRIQMQKCSGAKLQCLQNKDKCLWLLMGKSLLHFTNGVTSNVQFAVKSILTSEQSHVYGSQTVWLYTSLNQTNDLYHF